MERKPERQNNDKTAPQAGAQGSGQPAALLQTQAARRGSAFRQGLALLCDSPRRPPIVSRREFCLQAMLVAGRWLIALMLFYLLYSQFYTVQGDFLVRRPLPLALLMLGVIFLAFLGAQLAYFFVIYRRLRGLGLARPGLGRFLYSSGGGAVRLCKQQPLGRCAFLGGLHSALSDSDALQRPA